MLSASTKSSQQQEHGVYLVTTAIMLIALLIVCGLVIDGGGLFRMYFQWKNALDAGAVAGGIALDNNPNLSETDLQGPIANLIEVNLKEAAVPQTSIRSGISTLNFNVSNNSPFTFDISGTIPQPSWLLGSLPGFPDEVAVRARAAVKIERIMLSLVIDASGSMRRCIDNGPEGSGTYDDGSTNGAQVLDLCLNPNNIRMDALKRNVHSLIDRLRAEDWISITAFNNQAWLVKSMTKVDDVSYGDLKTDQLALKNLVNGIYAGVPGPFTKLRDGLQLGRRSIMHSPSQAQNALRKILLLVTDGAPLEENTDAGTLSWPDYSSSQYINDPLHPDDGIPWDSNIDISAPVIQNNDVDPALLGRTSAVYCRTVLEYQGGASYNPSYPAPFYDERYPPYGNPNSNEQDVKNMQILSVVQADLALSAGIQIFSIGIGDPDDNQGPQSPISNCSEYAGPFQAWRGNPLGTTCHSDNGFTSWPAPELHDVKQFLLQRISNDRVAFDSVRIALNDSNKGLHEYPCVRSTDELSSFPRGQYIFAGNLAAFQSAFAQFSQRVRLTD